MSLAQNHNLVIQTGATFSGTGTTTVKGNITNSGVSTQTTINGVVTMVGVGAQTIGTATNAAINFQTLNIAPTVAATTTMNVASTVSTAVNIGTAIQATLAVGGVASNSLTIGGLSAFGSNASSALTTIATSTVAFSQAADGQIVLGGFTYTGNLTLSGGTKTLNAATATTVGVVFDASAAGLLTISGGGLTLGTTGTFATAAISSGTITGGTGLATFNGLLTKTGTSNLTSGSGNLSLLAGLTNTAGNITLAAGQSMSISGGQFAYTAGTLTFPATSTVTYGASATTIVDAAYGNLTLNTDPKTWNLAAARTISGILTLGSGGTVVSGAFDLNVTGNISLASNLTKNGANAVVFANAASAVSGSGFDIVGSVTRTHTFTALQSYTFNNASMIVTPTAITNLTSFTINSLPSTAPTDYSAANSVNRKYISSYVGTGFTATVQLAYLATEFSGTVAKLKDFQNGIAKAKKLGGSYTRSSANGFAYVSLPGLTNSILNSGQELALDDRYNIFTSASATNIAWNVGATWDMGSIPTSADDVDIAPLYAVTIPASYNALANSVTIEEGSASGKGGLTLTAGTVPLPTTLVVSTGGAFLNNNTLGTGLNVGINASVTITGGNLTTTGSITNNGTINVGP
jgi:fibronectin-binding autotransporter adhesin